tara:strand:- start:67 stop:432 length:366 start_codon:yes stop_codon:yes gene_type:complete
MEDFKKFIIAITNLKPKAQYVYSGEVPTTEELFNEVEWATGIRQNGTATLTKTNPHSELTWTLVKAEMDRLQAEYDAQDYARKRKAEYPNIDELVVALYDSDDKAAVDEKRAAVKLKYPKP